MDKVQEQGLCRVVCAGVLHEPVKLPCSGPHLLCKACWMTLRLNAGSLKSQLPCPQCRGEVPVAQVKPSRVIEHMIEQSLQLICNDNGCPLIMTMGKGGANCIEHKSKCLLTLCSDCNTQVPLRRMALHRDTDCFFACPACDERLPCTEREQHLRGGEDKRKEERKDGFSFAGDQSTAVHFICVNTQLCPNACAKKAVLKSEFEQHLRDECRRRPVRCHDPHCVKLHSLEDLLKDVRDNLDHVYPTIAADLRQASAREQQLQAETQAAKAEAEQLRAQLREMKQKMQLQTRAEQVQPSAAEPADAEEHSAAPSSPSASSDASASSSSASSSKKADKKLQAKLSMQEKAREKEEGRLRQQLSEHTDALAVAQQQVVEAEGVMARCVDEVQEVMRCPPYPAAATNEDRWAVLLELLKQQLTDFRQVLILMGLVDGVDVVSIDDCQRKVEQWVKEGSENGWTAHMSLWFAAVREFTASREWKAKLEAILPEQRTAGHRGWMDIARTCRVRCTQTAAAAGAAPTGAGAINILSFLYDHARRTLNDGLCGMSGAASQGKRWRVYDSLSMLPSHAYPSGRK